MVYTSSEPVYHKFDLLVNYTDRNTGEKMEALYRFRAQSLKGEDSPFNIPDIRAIKDSNLIIILGQNVNENDRVI